MNLDTSFCISIFTGLSEDGTTVLIVKRKELQNMKRKFLRIREAANSTAGFGFRSNNDHICVDKKHFSEAQITMTVTKTVVCYMVFVNGGNPHDIEVARIPKESTFFADKVEGDVTDFFNTYFIQQLVLKNIPIKSPAT